LHRRGVFFKKAFLNWAVSIYFTLFIEEGRLRLALFSALKVNKLPESLNIKISDYTPRTSSILLDTFRSLFFTLDTLAPIGKASVKLSSPLGSLNNSARQNHFALFDYAGRTFFPWLQ
jgi:hypothetical protein